jgi:hypothetical protein
MHACMMHGNETFMKVEGIFWEQMDMEIKIVETVVKLIIN